MSAISAAMSGMRAAAARLEVSAENLVSQNTRGQSGRAEAAPPQKPANTPVPKVYRAVRANLYALDPLTGAAPAVDPASERLEQIQAAVHYRASLRAFETAQRLEDAALDILT